jgi:hypothetical protein
VVCSLQGTAYDPFNVAFRKVWVSVPSYGKVSIQDLLTSVLLFLGCRALLGSREVFGSSSQELGHVGRFLSVGCVCRFLQSLEQLEGDENGG